MGDAADAGHEGSIGSVVFESRVESYDRENDEWDYLEALLSQPEQPSLAKLLEDRQGVGSLICARCPQSGRRVERSLSLYTSSDLRDCGLVLHAAPVLLLVIASITALPDLGGNGGGGGLEGKSSGSAFWKGIGEFGAVDDEGQVEVTDWEGAGGAGNVAMGCNAGGGGGGSAGRWVRPSFSWSWFGRNERTQRDSWIRTTSSWGLRILQPCLRQGEWDRALEVLSVMVQNGEAVATGVDTAQPKPLDIKRAHPELVIMLRGRSFFDLMGKGDVVRAAAYYDHHIKRTYPDDTAGNQFVDTLLADLKLKAEASTHATESLRGESEWRSEAVEQQEPQWCSPALPSCPLSRGLWPQLGTRRPPVPARRAAGDGSVGLRFRLRGRKLGAAQDGHFGNAKKTQESINDYLRVYFPNFRHVEIEERNKPVGMFGERQEKGVRCLVCHRVFRRYNPAKLRFHQLRDPAGRQALCAASSQYVREQLRKAEQDGGGGGSSSHRAAHTSEESALPLPTDAGHGVSTSTSSTERLPPPPPPVLGDAEEAEAASPEDTPGAGGGTSSVN
nr:unnamed protein product [Digitaria exilis]